ncbi:RNase P subunit p30 family protein [Halobium salinum]|uniref:Ribonuclease P protein component 3 n=1 Tax=Halobium salinum TaxID=1364940 RepID=A0ABD5PGX3_9EURY|nr:RNase P subunit p30 family protein [Halobium salinum]
MYEAVHPYPDGRSTPARYAREAARGGFEGVVVRGRSAVDEGCGAGRADGGDGGGGDGDNGDTPAGPFGAVADRYGLDVVDAVEVSGDDRSSVSGAIGNYRPKTTLLLVRGGDDDVNRLAVEQVQVDVLTRPMRGDGGFNHVLAKAARDNGVRVEFDLSSVLRRDGGHRVQALQDLRLLRKLVTKFDVPYVVSANPRSHLQLRAPRELAALGEVVGFEAAEIREGLAEWGRLAARNRERSSDSFIAPGVQRGRYEEDHRGTR